VYWKASADGVSLRQPAGEPPPCSSLCGETMEADLCPPHCPSQAPQTEKKMETPEREVRGMVLRRRGRRPKWFWGFAAIL